MIPRLWVADWLPLIRRYSVQPVGWCWSQWLLLVANLPQRGVVQRDGGVLGMVGWSFLFGYERSAVRFLGCLDPAALLGVWLLAGGVGFLWCLVWHGWGWYVKGWGVLDSFGDYYGYISGVGFLYVASVVGVWSV